MMPTPASLSWSKPWSRPDWLPVAMSLASMPKNVRGRAASACAAASDAMAIVRNVAIQEVRRMSRLDADAASDRGRLASVARRDRRVQEHAQPLDVSEPAACLSRGLQGERGSPGPERAPDPDEQLGARGGTPGRPCGQRQPQVRPTRRRTGQGQPEAPQKRPQLDGPPDRERGPEGGQEQGIARER